jgi:hypothetical protein
VLPTIYPPAGMAAIVKAAQVVQAEMLARTVTKKDFEEVRSMMATNADLHLQLAKANAQNGAVRAEKDSDGAHGLRRV